jgi:hypothetical protein
MRLFMQDRGAADASLRDSPARAEIYAAYQRLFNAPEYTKTVLEPIIVGYFAVAFYPDSSTLRQHGSSRLQLLDAGAGTGFLALWDCGRTGVC